MFFYKGKKPAAQVPVSPKAKPKAPVMTPKSGGKLPPPKKAVVKPPPPPVEPPDDTKTKKKKKKKKEEESYAGMVTNWFNSIDTSQYVGTANAYLETAKAAANSAVTNYAPTSVQGALGTGTGEVSAPPKPVPKQPAPAPVVAKKVVAPSAPVVKKSALGGLFGVGKAPAGPKKAVVGPKPAASGPKIAPTIIPSPAVRFDETSESGTETSLIVKLGPRVPPKPDGPVLNSAADLRKAMENLRIGGFDDEPLNKHRDLIVNNEPGPIIMEFEKLRPPEERLHPQVAPRRASDGDGPVGADAAYYGALADVAGMEDPLDFVERSGIDRVIHSRQFVEAMKQSLVNSKGAISPSNVLGDFHPTTHVEGRPISPSQDNMKTIAFLPLRSNMCAACGLFSYACICYNQKPQKPTWDPLEASRRRKEHARRRSSHGSADSPENSQDEGSPPNIITVNHKPRLNPLR